MNSQGLSEHNQKVFGNLQQVVSILPFQLQKFVEFVMEIKQDQESTVNVITSQTDNILKKLLMTLLNVEVDTSSPDWDKKCGLPEQRLMTLKNVLQAVCGGPASQNIRRSVVISFIQNVLECLGVSDLTEMLDVISAQIPRFASQLEETDELKLLRVINVLLKTVSKTQDFQLRGQLHLALTRFLPFCHDSGFHFRAQPSKASESEDISAIQEQQQLVNGLSFEFYEQFWELQKWLIEPFEPPGKEGMLIHLKKMEKILKEVQEYFDTNPAIENPDYYNQPIKYLKNYNLLALQLGDLAFRKTVMLQVLLYTHSLKNPMTRSPVVLSDADKKVIPEIEAIPKKFLSSCGKDGKKILEELPKILSGEQEWTLLKEQWKDKKKTILKRAEQFQEEEQKSREQAKKIEKDLDKKRSEARKRISEKVKLEGSKIQRFLENRDPINLQAGATYTSYSYFFTQAMNCLKSFDLENGKQNQFDSRAEYNMFEWKAMRSLYRENLRDIWNANDKAPAKMKEYRLISLMNRKEEEFADPEPTKKIKNQ